MRNTERTEETPWQTDYITEARKVVPVGSYLKHRYTNLDYVKMYSTNAFYFGLLNGSIYGVYKASIARNIRKVPLYGIGAGVACAAFSGLSAFFRNEL
mmetsp:Transcript_30177/g.26728  ORF Transcript_30177/g.26728 Transcript_30177/m.26728 type:complete len:98 (+) Transcript_30177:22-315(+)